jgi:hypothetical protein
VDGVVIDDRLLEAQRGLKLMVVTARENYGPARFSGFHHVAFLQGTCIIPSQNLSQRLFKNSSKGCLLVFPLLR